jgi:hypothetical protein
MLAVAKQSPELEGFVNKLKSLTRAAEREENPLFWLD